LCFEYGFQNCFNLRAYNIRLLKVFIIMFGNAAICSSRPGISASQPVMTTRSAAPSAVGRLGSTLSSGLELADHFARSVSTELRPRLAMVPGDNHALAMGIFDCFSRPTLNQLRRELRSIENQIEAARRRLDAANLDLDRARLNAENSRSARNIRNEITRIERAIRQYRQEHGATPVALTVKLRKNKRSLEYLIYTRTFYEVQSLKSAVNKKNRLVRRKRHLEREIRHLSRNPFARRS
jgi:hypothetical protein